MSTRPDDNKDGDELQVHCSAPWISVPQSIILDRSIGDAACRVIIYLIDRVKMPDWKVKIYRDVLPRFGISEYRWPRIRREMELAGYYKCEKIKSKNGPFVQVHHVYYPPQRPHDNKSEETVKSPPSHSGVSDSGVSDWGVLFKTKESKQKSSTRASRVPARAGAAAASSAARIQSKARRVRASGLVTWYPEDEVESEILELQTPPSELAAAVAAEQAAGREPVPGRVACRLLQQRQAEQRAEAAEQAERRAAAIQAASRRRGDRDMAELMALNANQSVQVRDP